MRAEPELSGAQIMLEAVYDSEPERWLLYRLLEEGEISFEMRGRHRRVRLVDLVEYQTRTRQDRERALAEMAERGVHPAAIVWIVLFSVAGLFGCIAFMIRFWTKLLSLQREIPAHQMRPAFAERAVPTPLPPPRMEPIGSVTENTTRTFSPIYTEPSDRTGR